MRALLGIAAVGGALFWRKWLQERADEDFVRVEPTRKIPGGGCDWAKIYSNEYLAKIVDRPDKPYGKLYRFPNGYWASLICWQSWESRRGNFEIMGGVGNRTSPVQQGSAIDMNIYLGRLSHIKNGYMPGYSNDFETWLMSAEYNDPSYGDESDPEFDSEPEPERYEDTLPGYPPPDRNVRVLRARSVR